MKGTTHALVGGLVGAVVGSPIPAFLAGAASHVLLDLMPHRDEYTRLQLVADGCGALAVLALAAVTGHVGMAAGVLGGVLPDLDNVPDLVLKRKVGKIFPSHWRERGLGAGGRWAALETAVFIAAAIGLAAVLHRTGPAGVLK